MDVTTLLLGLLFGLAIGAGLTAWLLVARSSRERVAARERTEAARAEAAHSREELARAQTSVRMLEQRRQEDAERRSEDADVLKALAPLGERLRRLQDQVGTLERDRVEQYATLEEQLRSAALTDHQLVRQTQDLLSTLRSTSARGHWGEVQLRRVVEAAGMLAHTDFTEQTTVAGEDGARLRPDLLVKLPQGKVLAVDAKAPAGDGIAAQHLAEEQDEQAVARREELLARHAKAVRAHVDALAQKRYWRALQATPEVVLCFLPSESLLASALEADPELLDHAFARQVALVAPVSLLTALKAVAHAWRQEQVAQNAHEVAESARVLYERLSTLSRHLGKLGGSLTSAVKNYNALVGTLESRVLPAARRMQELDPGLGTELPEPASSSEAVRPLTAPELTAPEDTGEPETSGTVEDTREDTGGPAALRAGSPAP